MSRPDLFQNKASDLAENWSLDPAILYLNHGSFGACPRVVQERRRLLLEEMEIEPMAFLDRRYFNQILEVREELGRFIGAEGCDLAFVPNATTAVNTVLNSLQMKPGDELLVTDHEYAACKNAVIFTAERMQARLVVVKLPFPISDPDQALETVMAAVTNRTRFALIDHITSPTALVLPVRRLVTALKARRVRVMVDGAHAVGMLPLNLKTLGADYYTSNCHKWLCSPKGSAFLHVSRDLQQNFHPLVISHGYAMEETGMSRFNMEFDWCGTFDPTPFLCIPEAIRHLESLLAGGWPALMERNHRLALSARDLICNTLGIDPPCPDSMIGAMAAIPLPDSEKVKTKGIIAIDALQAELLERFHIEIPVNHWPRTPKRVMRLSAQLYNHEAQYHRLAGALKELLP